MELRQLRYFLAVAETGHLTQAAQRLGMQQPPLSLQIKQLEQQLGTPLFKRHPRGMALTDAGHLFQAEAMRLLADASALQQRMLRVARGEEGELLLGFTSSAAAHAFTPEVLRAFRRDNPQVRLVLHEDNAAGVTDALRAGRLHCGLIRVPVSRPSGLVFEPLVQESVLAALPIDWSPEGGAPISLEELCRHELILVRRPGAPGLYGNLLQLCHARGLQPRIAAEVARMMTNLNLVAAGAGVSVVPQSMATLHPHAIAYRPLRDCRALDAPLTMVYPDAADSAVRAHFVALVRSMARHWGAA